MDPREILFSSMHETVTKMSAIKKQMQVLQQNKCFFSWQNIKYFKQKMNVI